MEQLSPCTTYTEPCAATTEVHVPRVCAPQQETHCRSSPLSPQLEKALEKQWRPSRAKNLKTKTVFKSRYPTWTYCVAQNSAVYSISCHGLYGKGSKQEPIYVYIQLGHFVVQHKAAWLCKSTIFQDKQKTKTLFRDQEIGFQSFSHGWWFRSYLNL